MPYSSNTVAGYVVKAMWGSSHTSDFPATWYFALFYGDPEAGGLEPDSTGSYARLAVTNNDTEFTRSGRQAINANDWAWPTSSAAYQYTTLDHWAAYDNSSGGTRYASGPITIGGVRSSILINGAGLTPKAVAGEWVWLQGL